MSPVPISGSNKELYLSVFGDDPWLIWLCYAVAAIVLAKSVQLQFSMRPGGKHVRGVAVWREDLLEPVAESLNRWPAFVS